MRSSTAVILKLATLLRELSRIPKKKAPSKKRKNVAPMKSTLNPATLFITSLFLLSLPHIALAQKTSVKLTREQVIGQTMHPYSGISTPGVDASTLDGKVMCGYQGWHTAEGDGADRGWRHWGLGGKFEPGHCKFDLWPDVSELDPDERYPTKFRQTDGRAAEVYSSFNKKTVLRHFKWMQDYGLDGVFPQRFVGEVSSPLGLRHFNTVLAHCREGANRYGRTYAVMYDLSGMKEDGVERLKEDWKLLVDRMRITRDKAYLHHRGKPVVAVWGIGFERKRSYTLAECREIVRFLKDDPKYGGNTVMLGLPTYWRTLDHDAVRDEALHELIDKADIVSPWTVGRYGSPSQAVQYFQKTAAPDLAWCKEHGKDYLPVVFPGFSWHNMYSAAPLNQIPRQGGKFLWAQYAAAKKAGCTMVYQAMFDEVDEGTAIYKCTNDPPVGESKFLTYEGLPSDHYLKLVGTAAKMISGKTPLCDQMPPELAK
jgi:hypothetical protein